MELDVSRATDEKDEQVGSWVPLLRNEQEVRYERSIKVLGDDFLLMEDDEYTIRNFHFVNVISSLKFLQLTNLN